MYPHGPVHTAHGERMRGHHDRAELDGSRHRPHRPILPQHHRNDVDDDCVAGASFATLEWDDCQLMLQTDAILTGYLAVFGPDPTPVALGTIYLSSLHPDFVPDHVAPVDVVKGPERNWCGMTELYVPDSDDGAADEHKAT